MGDTSDSKNVYIQKNWYVYTNYCQNIWLSPKTIVTLPPSPDKETGGFLLQTLKVTIMEKNDTVRWNILQDHDGSIFFNSSKGVHVHTQNRYEAELAFEKLVQNTVDVMKAQLDRGRFSTIQFTLNCG